MAQSCKYGWYSRFIAQKYSSCVKYGWCSQFISNSEKTISEVELVLCLVKSEKVETLCVFKYQFINYEDSDYYL